ncbi:unnamed protein product [Cylindrotheca closterium]|uniref:DUF6824 domain-containing protein n=1 Tax=Cylindrotheca closterium TaxID=2856 RepID=A0AAD2G872_9STRA|nr:unnamed protein product [Cylindrotheca closterium]
MSAFNHSFNNSNCNFGTGNERRVPSTNALRRPQRSQVHGGLVRSRRSTPEDEKKKEIDDLLSEALKSLTFEERQEQQEILHGVAAKIAEEATFIEASLQELESHLSNIKNGSVYEMAEEMDPDYVTARAFQVMFLRGARYDSKAAADQMLSFFEMKLQLFGSQKLVKDITLHDLDEGDIECLKTGWVQLAGKDRCGRHIIVNLVGLREDKMTLQNELRAQYYMKMSVLESKETQIKGTIIIIHAVGDMKSRFRDSGYSENARIATAIPIHMSALHICTDEVKYHACLHSIIKVASMKLRARSRFHYGNQTECLYQMSTYGIPQTFLPVPPNTNKICLQRHFRWLESRFKMEHFDRPLSPAVAAAAVSNELVSPTETDVLVVGGNKSNNIGNKVLRATVKSMSQAYQAGSKESRRDLVDCAIHSVHEPGGRFLKQHTGGVWKELPKEQIRKLVAQAFRNSYKSRNRQK